MGRRKFIGFSRQVEGILRILNLPEEYLQFRYNPDTQEGLTERLEALRTYSHIVSFDLDNTKRELGVEIAWRKEEEKERQKRLKIETDICYRQYEMEKRLDRMLDVISAYSSDKKT
jgi:hypothetical protein